MRRTTASVLGTLIGTALLVGAKYGAPSAAAGAPTAISAGDPAAASDAAGASGGPSNAASSTAVVPGTSGTPAPAGAAPSGATRTTAPPQPGRTTPAAGGGGGGGGGGGATTAPPPPTCSTVGGSPVNVGGPGVGAVTVTIKVCNGTVSSASSTLNQSNYGPNAQALPAMNALVPQYYKTNISAIHYSGATYTSTAYQSSLQSALSKAGI